MVRRLPGYCKITAGFREGAVIIPENRFDGQVRKRQLHSGAFTITPSQTLAHSCLVVFRRAAEPPVFADRRGVDSGEGFDTGAGRCPCGDVLVAPLVAIMKLRPQLEAIVEPKIALRYQ